MEHVLRTRNGTLDPGDEAAFQTLCDRLRAKPGQIEIHLHGGLVDQTAGESIAARLGGGPPSGWTIKPDWEQVYIVWRTGAIETVKANWPELLNDRLRQVQDDRLFQTVFIKVVAFVAGRLTPGAAARGGLVTVLDERAVRDRLNDPAIDPFADVDEAVGGPTAPAGGERAGQLSGTITDVSDFAFALSQDPDIDRMAQDIVAATVPMEQARARASAPAGNPIAGRAMLDVLDTVVAQRLSGASPIAGGERAFFGTAEVVAQLVQHGSAIALRVLKRFTTGRHHGLYCTVLEETLRELYGDRIGIAVWGFIKQDAADHFRPGAFGDRLLDLLCSVPRERLVVTGHSAGSILASQLFMAAVDKGVAGPIDLVLLAPAVRIRLFAAMLQKAKGLIGRFRLFAMHDALERADPLLAKAPRLYPRSILYIVSGLFEASDGAPAADAPLLGMERFLAMNVGELNDPVEQAALTSTLQFLATAQNGVVFSKASGGPGLNSQSISHGGFDTEADTLASVSTFF